MSSNSQNLSSVEIKNAPLLRLGSILEANLIQILDPSVNDQSKASAARAIINSVKGVLPRKYWQLGEDKKVQAISSELRDTTVTLEALGAVQFWAADLLESQRSSPESVDVEKKALRWINSRSSSLDYVIGQRADSQSAASSVSFN